MRIIRKHVIHAVFLMIVPAIFLSGSLDAAALHEEIRDAGRDYSRGTWTPGGRMT